nr:carboxylesterase nlhh [Quercus suber]
MDKPLPLVRQDSGWGWRVSRRSPVRSLPDPQVAEFRSFSISPPSRLVVVDLKLGYIPSIGSESWIFGRAPITLPTIISTIPDFFFNMPFALDPDVAVAVGKLFGPNGPPPKPAVGDVAGRRAGVAGFFALLDQLQPTPVTNVETKDFHTSAPDGHQILLRWFTKADSPAPGSAILYAHGGGMISLQLENYDKALKRYVAMTGVPFLAVEYRLAPEVQAPIPVTDTYAGLQYLVAHAAELGVDPSRIGIMGDSAGGGIAASLAHYAKSKGGPALKKQILIYPMLDDRNVVPDPQLEPFLVWTVDDNKTGWGALLGDRVGGPNVPPTDAAGRMTVEDAVGLPPAYIDVGELDLFRDEGLEYARKVRFPWSPRLVGLLRRTRANVLSSLACSSWERPVSVASSILCRQFHMDSMRWRRVPRWCRGYLRTGLLLSRVYEDFVGYYRAQTRHWFCSRHDLVMRSSPVYRNW